MMIRLFGKSLRVSIVYIEYRQMFKKYGLSTYSVKQSKRFSLVHLQQCVGNPHKLIEIVIDVKGLQFSKTMSRRIFDTTKSTFSYCYNTRNNVTY